MYDTPRFTLTLTYFKSFRRYAKRKSRGIDHFDSSKLTKIQYSSQSIYFSFGRITSWQKSGIIEAWQDDFETIEGFEGR